VISKDLPPPTHNQRDFAQGLLDNLKFRRHWRSSEFERRLKAVVDMSDLIAEMKEEWDDWKDFDVPPEEF